MNSDIHSIKQQNIMLYLQLLENITKILNINYMDVDINRLTKIIDELYKVKLKQTDGLSMNVTQANETRKPATNVVVAPNGLEAPLPSCVNVNIPKAIPVPKCDPFDSSQTNSAITKANEMRRPLTKVIEGPNGLPSCVNVVSNNLLTSDMELTIADMNISKATPFPKCDPSVNIQTNSGTTKSNETCATNVVVVPNGIEAPLPTFVDTVSIKPLTSEKAPIVADANISTAIPVPKHTKSDKTQTNSGITKEPFPQNCEKYFNNLNKTLALLKTVKSLKNANEMKMFLTACKNVPSAINGNLKAIEKEDKKYKLRTKDEYESIYEDSKKFGKMLHIYTTGVYSYEFFNDVKLTVCQLVFLLGMPEFLSSCGGFITKLRAALSLLRKLEAKDPIPDYKLLFQQYKDLPSIINSNVKEIERRDEMESLFKKHEYDSIYQVTRCLGKLLARVHQTKDDKKMFRKLRIQIMETVSKIIPLIQLLLYFCFEKNMNPTVQTNNTSDEKSRFLLNGILKTKALASDFENSKKQIELNQESNANEVTNNSTKRVHHGYSIEAKCDLTNLKQEILKVFNIYQEINAKESLNIENKIIADDTNKAGKDFIKTPHLEIAVNDNPEAIESSNNNPDEILESNVIKEAANAHIERLENRSDSNENNDHKIASIDMIASLSYKNKLNNDESAANPGANDDIASPSHDKNLNDDKNASKDVANGIASISNHNKHNDKSDNKAVANDDIASPSHDKNLIDDKNASKDVANAIASISNHNKHNDKSDNKAVANDDIASPSHDKNLIDDKNASKDVANAIASISNHNKHNDKSDNKAVANDDIASPSHNKNLNDDKNASKDDAYGIASLFNENKLDNGISALKARANFIFLRRRPSSSQDNNLNNDKSASKDASNGIASHENKLNVDKSALKPVSNSDIANPSHDKKPSIVKSPWFTVTRENYIFSSVILAFSNIVVDKYIAYDVLAWNMIVKVGRKHHCCCCNAILDSVNERQNHLKSEGHATSLIDVGLLQYSYNLLRPCKTPEFSHCGVCNVQYNTLSHLTSEEHKLNFNKARSFVVKRLDLL